MTHAIEWLLGLEHVRLDGGALSLELADPAAGWAMLVGAVLVVIAIIMIYRLEPLPRRWRFVLATIRICLLMTVLGMLASPNLVMTRERIEPSVVAILVDASDSMRETDGDASDNAPNSTAGSHGTPTVIALGASSTTRPTRLDRAIAVVRAELDRTPTQADRRRMELWRFAGSSERVSRAATADELAALARPQSDAHITDLTGALNRSLEQTRGARLAGVVVLGDGRQTATDGTDALLDEALRRSVPVHTIAVGSALAKRDLELGPIGADEDVFINDVISIQTRVTAEGIAAPARVAIKLLDAESGDEITRDELDLQPGSAGNADATPRDDDAWFADAELRLRGTRTGRLNMRVEVEPLDGEADLVNNRADVAVRVHDEKLRVLFVDGPPRYEYRFLKTTMVREPTIDSSCLLLEATSSFVQEGSTSIQAFPVSPGELNQYDVVILGDVDPRDDWISPAQVAMLEEFVGVRGGGLGFIAGQRAMPHRLAGTPLQKLLPVRLRDAPPIASEDAIHSGYSIRVTPSGARHALLRFEIDPAENQTTIESLRPWFWFAPIRGIQPGAEILATHPTHADASGPTPLIVAGRFGAGRTLYVGSDDVWRWRHYRGEAYYDAFWINAVRMLAGDRRWGASRTWRLSTDRRYYPELSRVVVRLSARDPSAAAGVREIDARIERPDGEPVATLALRRAAPDQPYFEGVFHPDRAGVYTIVAQVATTGGGDLPARSVTVRDESPESRRTQADYAFLRRIAEGTGGRFATADHAPAVFAAIPDRSVIHADETIESIWDTRLALLIIALLAITEWAARKLKGMA